VLELHPELAPRLRVIETRGPSTIPPAVILTSVPEAVRRCLRQALLGMHADEEGRGILSAAMMARFVEIADEEYDDIRRMAVEAERVELAPLRAAVTGG
jgi:ABC-type phosphate/phosphonate transport system substrate-binding protein